MNLSKLSATAIAALLLPIGAVAQLDLPGAVQRGAEWEARRQAEKLGRNAVRCAVDNLKCIKKAEKKGKEVVLVDENGNVISDPNDSTGKPPGLSSSTHSGSDFEPGTRVLFEEDFAAESIGGFPADLEEIQGKMSVVEWNGQRYLRNEEKYSRMAVSLPESLPEAFTMEFDLFEGTNGGEGVSIALVAPSRFDFAWMHYYDYDYLNIGHQQTVGLWGPKSQRLAATDEPRPSSGIVPVKIMVRGEKLKMYIGERQVAETSDASLGRSDKVYFFLDSVPPENLTYIGNIRIAAIE